MKSYSFAKHVVSHRSLCRARRLRPHKRQNRAGFDSVSPLLRFWQTDARTLRSHAAEERRDVVVGKPTAPPMCPAPLPYLLRTDFPFEVAAFSSSSWHSTKACGNACMMTVVITDVIRSAWSRLSFRVLGTDTSQMRSVGCNEHVNKADTIADIRTLRLFLASFTDTPALAPFALFKTILLGICLELSTHHDALVMSDDSGCVCLDFGRITS